MLRISKLTDYAIVILGDMAQQPNQTASAKALVERTDLGLATVKKILRQLLQSGLLTSAQGTKGGYILSRDASSISLADTIKAMEGGIAITDCSKGHSDCSKIDHCPTSKNWQYINNVIFRSLDKISIKQMHCQPNEWETIHFNPNIQGIHS